MDGILIKVSAFLPVAYLVYYILRSYFSHYFLQNTAALGYSSPLPRLGDLYRPSQSVVLFFKIILLALSLRLLVYCLTYVSYSMFYDHPGSFLGTFKEIWFKWDSDNFTIIAEHWYAADGPDKFRLVFYPFYPILLKGVQLIVGDYFIAGIILSLTSYSLASWFLFQLVKKECGDEKTAWNAVKFMGIYPFSFFFGIVYTESLFLMLIIGCFYFMRREMWLYAGLMGCGAAFCRNQGILLVAPLLLEATMRYPIYCKTNKTWHVSRQLLLAVGSSLIVLMGFVGYLVVNKQVTGDFFTFLDYQQQNWGNHFSFFANNVGEIYNRIYTEDKFRMIMGVWAPVVVLFFVCVTLMVHAAKKLPLSYTVYGLCMLVVSYSPSWLLSGPRYTAVIFPIFVGLAFFVRNRPNMDQLLTVGSTGLLGLYAFLFSRHAVY